MFIYFNIFNNLAYTLDITFNFHFLKLKNILINIQIALYINFLQDIQDDFKDILCDKIEEN
jgi:hypothetical protein